MAEATVIDTPAGIQFAGLLQLKYRLKIEIDTGLRHSGGSTLKLVNQLVEQNWPDLGPRWFRRKLEAYEWLCLVIEEIKRAREQ